MSNPRSPHCAQIAPKTFGEHRLQKANKRADPIANMQSEKNQRKKQISKISLSNNNVYGVAQCDSGIDEYD